MDYIIPNQGWLISNGESVHLDAPQSRFILNDDNNRLCQVRGGWENEQVVSAIDGAVITVSDGSAFTRGDQLKIISDEPLSDYTLGGLLGEFVEVASVSGNDVTLVQVPYYTYNVASNCRVARILSDVRVRIDVGEVIISPQANSGRAIIQVYSVVDPVVNVGYVPLIPRNKPLVRIVSCVGGETVVDHGDTASPGEGYGITTAGTERHSMRFKYCGAVRHAIDSGPGGGDGTDNYVFEQHGAAAYNRVYGSMVVGAFGAYASHHGTRQMTVEDSIGIGCAGVVGMRGVGNVARRVTSYMNTDNSFGTGLQYGPGEAMTDNTVFEDCNQILGHARAFDLTAGSVVVRGGMFELATGYTTSSFVLIEGANVRFEGAPEIILNGTASTSLLTIDGTTTSVDFGNMRIRFNYTGSISRLIRDVADAAATVKWHGMYIDNPSLAITNIFGDSVPAAGCRFGDLTITGTYTNLVLNQTIDQVYDHVVGVIRQQSTALETRPVNASRSLGTITTGIVQLVPSYQRVHYTNNGAHVLAPPAADCDIVVLITNGASAGTITTSGFTRVVGDSFATTVAKEYKCTVSRLNSVPILEVKALNP